MAQVKNENHSPDFWNSICKSFLKIPKIFIFSCLCSCTKRIVSWLVSSRMSTQTTTAPHRPSSKAISRPMPLPWTSLYLDRKRCHSIIETSSFLSDFQVHTCIKLYILRRQQKFSANYLLITLNTNVVGMSIEKMWRNDEMTKFWNIM